jgi:hypothetical protein
MADKDWKDLMAKLPKYLSPSSLKTAVKQPYTFYLTRLVDNPIPREPQSLPGAMGSAFDVFVKLMLVIKGRVDLKPYQLQTRLLDSCYDPSMREQYAEMDLPTMFYKMSVEEQHQAAVKDDASALMVNYCKSSLFMDLAFHDLEIHRYFSIMGNSPDSGQALIVPIFMKGDASVTVMTQKDNYEVIPLDWKVTGYGSATGASPTAGYKRIWSIDKGLEGPHPDYTPDRSMALVDEAWADQLCVYGWGMGRPVGLPFRAIIHQLVFRPSGWRIAEFDSWITTETQLRLRDKFVTLWSDLQSGRFAQRIVQDRTFAEWYASTESWR